MATITLWRTAARRPAKLKKKFLISLLRSERIDVQAERLTIEETYGLACDLLGETGN